MRANDVIVGGLLVIFAAAMIAYTATFPAFPGQRYGPSLFPRLLGVGMIITGLVLMRRGWAERAGQGWIEFSPWMRQPAPAISFLLVLGSLFFYVFASETMGFIIVATVILATLFYWFGVRPLWVAPIALGSTLAIHWFFSSLMRVPLPRGWLDSIL
jgi:putative tricarboxylic transport membrane protein